MREKIWQQYLVDMFTIEKLVRMMRYAGEDRRNGLLPAQRLFNGGEMDPHYIFSLALISFVAFLCFKFRKNK